MNIKVVTLCGSMRYKNEMIQVATDLEKKFGWCVLQCVYGLDEVSNEEMQKITNAHWKRIDISDAIYVLNINGYIGNATKNEIKYAKTHNKEIFYHENIQ